VTKVYKRDLDITRYNVPFLLNPFHFDVHVARLSGHVYVLPVAADAFRASLAAALERRYRDEVKYALEAFPAHQGNLLRRRHVQLPQGTHHRALLEAEAAELHVVLHVARDHRLRHAEGHEGSGLPAADRGL
jgi:hypothetical protein